MRRSARTLAALAAVAALLGGCAANEAGREPPAGFETPSGGLVPGQVPR
ncbi:hypothetical protein [Aurantimonas sp. Leaf443]|nr:hypothetical protein [Aurantimonas sp. Leaf443]